MNVTTFCQSYIDLADSMLTISQKPEEIERERKRLKQESKDYVDYLEKFEVFFEVYPALKKELFGNLSDFKVGAFVEYRLDLFHAQLKKIDKLKADIQEETSVLRKDFAEEAKEWLPEEENTIAGCFRYLDTANVTQVIGFLEDRLMKLKAKKDAFSSERQRLLYASKADERQAEETRRLQAIEDARRRGVELTQAEIEERRKKAQEAYKKQMNRRKKQ